MHKTYLSKFLRLLGMTGAACLLLAIPVMGATAAASTDRDHPTTLISNELKGDVNASGTESFYSFIAGPGDLTITVDVKSTDGMAVLNFELLDKNAANSLVASYTQADSTGQSERKAETVKLDSRETVVLLIRPTAGMGTYTMRLSGAAVMTEKPSATATNTPAEPGRMGLPTTGMLRIESKDGSVKEIDLSLVKEITIKS